ncbi:protein JASON-like [Macadamia integrifolia]|uniref:protein JASON-like n=1 Tax=Macadamia integrifolia TaxID=60698 RepID=UPI001C4F043D|nr:protein JASON-like [Macadamia integrifolia]
MGCFLACFGSSKNKDRKRRRKHKVLPGDQRHGSCDPPKPTPSLNQESKETSIGLISEQRDKPEEQLSLSARKKVTFDLNVKTYEHVPEPEAANHTSENEEEKERGKEEEKSAKTCESLSVSEDDSVTSSLGSYPPNHRYQNCRDSDDEDGGIDDGSDLEDDDDEDDDEDFDDEDVEPTEFKEESSESFFSLPAESRTQTCATPPNEKEVNSSMKTSDSPEQELKTTLPLNQNARDRSKYIHSVLNPVENLSQWKAVKARPRAATPPSKNQKENTKFEEEPQIPFSSEPTFKLSPLKSNQSFSHSRPAREEISVDASLSNWLVSTETKPNTQTSSFTFVNESTEKSRSQRSNSPISPEDRPILGALTVEELKQFSASTSPRKSPSRSPEEIPIIGTVGSYWSHTGQATDSSSGSSCKGGIPNTTSKYREDKRVNWHSTPFERRLERALERGSAEAYTSKF